MKNKRYFFIVQVFVFLSYASFSQKDTAFWFAVPMVSQAHGVYSTDLDTPMYLRITAYTQPSVVSVYKPADPTFTPIVFTLPAYRTQTVDLSLFKTILECTPADQALNYGLKISSTTPISVYYEENSPLNPELFTLKGSNALGTSFYIPGQNLLDNINGYIPQPYNSFDIVATQDNTSVTITPTQPITGHSAGASYTITLNQGQTYSATATSTAAANHLQGSTVTSTKPIAITVKDDLLDATPIWTLAYDLAGDQIIPISKLGTEYIAVQGELQAPYDAIFILATQNNTTITQDGTVTGTINAGATQSFYMSGPTASTYIQTSNPAYVWQMSGLGGEVGAGILPPIKCTGSYEVAFVRPAPSLYIQLLVEAGGQNNFLFNGTTSVISGGSFTTVPGTSGQWMAAQFQISTTQLPIDSPALITNSTNLFHMGMVSGTPGGGGEFGYFSNFNSFQVNASNVVIGPCNNAINLLADSIAGAVYAWSGPNSFISSAVNPVISNPTSSDTGTYTLSVTYGSCSGTSTTHVQLSAITGAPVFSLGNDTSYCGPFSRVLSSGVAATKWSTGATGASITVTAPGLYWARDSSACGTFTDTIIISAGAPPPPFDLGSDTTYCGSFSRTLSTGNTTTLWNTGVTDSAIQISSPGIYWAEISNGCASRRDSINITQNPLPVVNLGNDTNLCPGNTLVLNATTASATYLWENNSTSPTLTVSSAGLYWVDVTVNGCSKRDSITVGIISPGNFKIGRDTTYCGPFSRVLTAGIADVIWSTGDTALSITVTSPGTYSGHIIACSDTLNDTITIAERPLPMIDLGNDTTLCSGDTIILNAGNPGGTYLWQNNSTSQTYTVSDSGIYRVIVTADSCSAGDSIRVSYTQAPSLFSLGSDTTICEDSSIILSAYEPNVTYYVWNTGDTTPFISVSQSGTYTVKDSNQCGTATASQSVTVAQCTCKIAIPNAFSPNNDGKNDSFGIVYECPLQIFSMNIYNRWGQLIFSTHNVSDKWDGGYKGQQQPLGVYVYMIGYTDPYTNIQKALSGNVTLLR
jgi:gliding motility-associated-like protein